MITIDYTGIGTPWSDFNYDLFVELVKDYIRIGRTVTLKVSTTPPIDGVRLAVAKGEISPDNVQFMFKDQIIRVNRYGRVYNCPEGFLDCRDKIIEQLLDVTNA